MTKLTKSTVHMMTVRSGIVRKEIQEEAAKLLDEYNSPLTTEEQRVRVKAKLDDLIRKLEDRVTTRKLREEKRKAAAGPQPPAP